MAPFDPDPAEQIALIETAHAMANAARAAILPYFRGSELGTLSKGSGDFDPVTAADRASEAAMRAVLAERRPDDAILGEEDVAKSGTTGLTWVIDPIDGTRGFVSGTPTWGVLISLNTAEGPVYGLIDQPYIGERFEGGFGRSEMSGPLGPRALGVRPATSLTEATLFTTFPEVGTPTERAAFERVRDRVKLVRYGCDCYAYALLAAGHVDLVIEAGLQPYDIAAPVALVQAAGGVITSWDGAPAHDGGTAIAAASPALHAEAMALLQKTQDV